MSKKIDEEKLMQICAEEAQKPDFPAKQYEIVGQQTAQAIESTALTIYYGIRLYEDTKAFLQGLFSGGRSVPRNKAIARVQQRYLNE